MAYLASKAIARCWIDDPASTRVAQALRAQARAYIRKPAADPYDEELIITIERAFVGTPPPVGSTMACLGDETADYALELDGS